MKRTKKLAALALAAALTFGGLAIPGKAVSADTSTTYNYNLNDAKLCLKLALGIIKMPADETQKAEYLNKYDVDNNKALNLIDANKVLKYALGILKPGSSTGGSESSGQFAPQVDNGLTEKLTPPAASVGNVDLDELKENGISVFPYELYKYTYYDGYYGFFYEDNILDELHQLYDLKVQAGDVNEKIDTWDKYIWETGADYYITNINNSDSFKDELTEYLTVSGEGVTPTSVEISGDAAFTLYSMAYFSDYKSTEHRLNNKLYCGYYVGPFAGLEGSEDDIYYAASSSAVMALGEWYDANEVNPVKKNISFCYLKPIILPTLEEQGYSSKIPADNPYDKYFAGFNEEFYNLMDDYSYQNKKGTAKFNKSENTVTITSKGWNNMTVPINTIGNYNGMFGYFWIDVGEWSPETESRAYNPYEWKKADNAFDYIIGKCAEDYPFMCFITRYQDGEPNPCFSIDGYENYTLEFEYIYMPDKSWLGPYYPDDADYAVVSNYFEGNTELNDFLNKDYYKKFWYFNVMKDCFVSVDGGYKNQAQIYGERDENGNTVARSKIRKASHNAYLMTH